MSDRPDDKEQEVEKNQPTDEHLEQAEKSDSLPPENMPKRKPVFFMVLIFFVLPILLIVFSNYSSAPKFKKLTRSALEKILNEGQVTSATFEKNTSAGAPQKIIGTYIIDAKSSTEAHFKTEVVYTELLESKLVNLPSYEIKRVSNFWQETIMGLLPFVFILFIIYLIFSRQLKSAGKGAMQFGKSRARLDAGSKVTFDDVAGLDESKEEVEEIVHYLKDPTKVQKLGGKVPKGVLMVGPPGTGKTLLARAIAGEAGAPFYSISGSDFVEMFVGVGASRVRDMFTQAKKTAPCLIFIDEIDAVGRARFNGMGGGNDEREQTLNALLVEMDGFESNSGIIVIAATNRPDVLDRALLRPGRFDRQITVNVPNRQGRKEILDVHAKKFQISEAVDMDVVARNTSGFSGADLANLLNEAALTAARSDKEEIDHKDIDEAKEKVLWGRERKSFRMSEKSRKNTAYHEAGHALVGLMLEDDMLPLHKVTIIPRGNFLGAAMYLPKDDEISKTERQLRADLAVTMGGRVAEKLIFGDVTTGASNDIMVATKTAKKMVCQWGMSKELGLVDYAPSTDNPYSSSDDSTKGSQHSNETSNKIDKEVRCIIETAVATAEKILTENRDKLEKFAEALFEKETMGIDEICELLDLDKEKIDPERFGDKPAVLDDEVTEETVEESSEEQPETLEK